MVDFGIDAPWLSHEPWSVPEPITPEPGELWSLDDIDYWVDTLEQVCREAYSDPELVKSAPHNHAVRRPDLSAVEGSADWATTWRALRRKRPDWARGRADLAEA
jgi:glycine dehydrogenase subunit 2